MTEQARRKQERRYRARQTEIKQGKQGKQGRETESKAGRQSKADREQASATLARRGRAM